MTASGTISQRGPARPASSGCNPTPAAPGVIRSWADVRSSTGLSIRDFAELVGINRGQLSKIERGLTCPTPSEADRLLRILVGRP